MKKVNKLVWFYGCVTLADHLEITPFDMNNKIAADSFSIDEMEKLNELYNEIPILPSES